jgi:hypothetical protein
MVEFQLAITGATAAPGLVPADEDADVTDERFATEQHRRGRRTLDTIDDLGGVWDSVIQKLTALAAQSRSVADRSTYELTSIEFNIGIEAGLNIGLVTKGEASVSLTFTRKPDQPDQSDQSDQSDGDA